MASFNKITIVGYLGRDPELRHIPSGNTVCNFSVATTEKNKDKESTTWFRVTVWGKQGENCNEYLSKGSQVYVEGRLRSEEFTDRDGNKRTSLEVNASDVKFLGSRTNDAPPPSREESQKRKEALKTVEEVQDEVDEEIPF